MFCTILPEQPVVFQYVVCTVVPSDPISMHRRMDSARKDILVRSYIAATTINHGVSASARACECGAHLLLRWLEDLLNIQYKSEPAVGRLGPRRAQLAAFPPPDRLRGREKPLAPPSVVPLGSGIRGCSRTTARGELHTT
jgi:hypothetical protein